MRATLPLGEWTPDVGGLTGSTLNVADNVLPGPNGYRPVPQFAALPSPALPGYPLGGASFVSAARIVSTFAGTATTLYLYSASGWLAVGTGYSATDDNPWSFIQFGQRIIATNGSDAPQYYDLDQSATFAPLPGITTGTTTVNPPRIKIVNVVRDFVFGGVIDGDASRLQWSGINNSSEWRPTYGQSDYNIAATGGAITAIAGGERGIVFQEDRICLATYVAGNVIFQFDEISPNVGCIHPRAFCQIGRMTYFLSARGFMACDGNSVSPIGDEKVDRTFLTAMVRGYLGRMSCVADPVRKVIFWTVPDAEPGVAYAYSWSLQRWSRVLFPARLLLPGRTRDVTLDELYGSPDTTYDTGLAFDDPSYRGGEAAFFVFNASNVYGALTGANMAAAIDLGPQEFAGPARLTAARRWRLVSDAVDGITLTLDARRRLGDAASITTHTGPAASGDIVGRRKGRTITPRIDFAAGTAWTYAQALECEYERAGGR